MIYNQKTVDNGLIARLLQKKRPTANTFIEDAFL